jgi:drug/metabolite transporter (DMT)-like permease
LTTTLQRFRQLPRNQRGALWMLASAVAFTLMTTLVKFLGEDYPPVLQTFYRQAATFLVMVPLMLRAPMKVFATTRPYIVIFRSVTSFLGISLSFYAYQQMPLADANALSFTRTLWIVLLAAFLLREPLGLPRIAATIAGFIGVLLIVQPHADSQLGLPAIAALASALLLAGTVTGMKIMTRDHSTTTLMAWAAVLGLVLSIPPALFVWRWPTTPDLLLLSCMGILGSVTQACYVKGMAAGDATRMAPMDYSRLLLAVIVGYAWFDTVPGPLTIVGSLIIIAATLYITLFENSVSSSATRNDNPG